MEAAQHPWPALGVLLLRDGLVEKEELEALLDEQRDVREQPISGWRLGEILVERGRVTEEEISRLVAEQYELPYVELETDGIDLRMASRLPAELVDRFSALPIELLDDGSVLVAVSDPATVLFSDELRRALGMPLRFAVVSPAAMTAGVACAREHERYEPSSPPEMAWPTGAPEFDLIPAEQDDESRAQAPPRSALTFAAPSATEVWPPLGALLVRSGLLSEDELETALAQQRLSSDMRLGEILVERGAVSRADVARVVAEQYELPFLDVAERELDAEVSDLLSLELARRYAALPLGYQPDGSLLVAVADPTTIRDPGELFSELGDELSFAVVDPDVIEAELLRRRLQPSPGSPDDAATWTKSEPHADEALGEELAATVEEPWTEPSEEPGTETSDSFEDVDEPPLAVVLPLDGSSPKPEVDDTQPEYDDEALDALVRISRELDAEPLARAPAPVGVVPDLASDLDALLERARELGATAIHLSQGADGLVARARVEGEQRVLDALPGSDAAAVSRALRSHGELDVVELPTRTGDLVVVQLFPGRDLFRDLGDLGFEPADEDAVRTALRHPSGLVLLAGPAGGGVTTTAYALLQELRSPERAILTIEDPIERVIAGVDQIESGPESGLTVAQGLGRILRASPEAIFVGETADRRTAELVVRGAQRALVLTTLHAHTAADAVRRLLVLGADPDVLASTLAVVVAQSRVRQICLECRESYYASAEELDALGRPPEEEGLRILGRGRGCETCGHTGFSGRLAVFELLPQSDALRRWIIEGGAGSEQATGISASADVHTLRDKIVWLCLDGLTTAAEARRVLERS
ncbi:MAG TPA: ATPase, T2SS/T4P/T4SS family [Gaiellaceae bacterium]|nr:ATPase, T2SS/T4P/T4SS family [Gaiellaceae bacterium]